MAKIKYQGGITKLIASKIGKKNRSKFLNYIHGNENLQTIVKEIGTSEKIDLDIVSFSSSYDFSEQVLSILSFVRYAGTPKSWIVYSDGSHTLAEISLLENTLPWVKVFKYNFSNEQELLNATKQQLVPWFKQLFDYASKKPLGKKLFCYLNHPLKETTIFLDSDILFYEKSNLLKTRLNRLSKGYFLPEIIWGSLDSRFTKDNLPQFYQVNSGFFIINKEFENLAVALEYLKLYNFEYEYFSEQTIFHVLFMNNGFEPLDPRIFILDVDDQFDFSSLHTRSKMAIRHFTGPVRHKMWQKNWKWQLSISS